MIHIVDPAGALLPGHAIDPMLWDVAPASECVLERAAYQDGSGCRRARQRARDYSSPQSKE